MDEIILIRNLFNDNLYIFGSTKGSHAWIKFGSLFSIQPAEFMKVAMILIMSYFLTESDKAFVVKVDLKHNS
ncbi:MAG: FtsW/RodA/SpoVE family cell cycle protein [Thomasclavelia ramosa]